MIDDDVMREVRAAKEAYAQSHNFDLTAIVADLRAKEAAGDRPVVRRPPRRPRQVKARKNRRMSPCSAPRPVESLWTWAPRTGMVAAPFVLIPP